MTIPHSSPYSPATSEAHPATGTAAPAAGNPLGVVALAFGGVMVIFDVVFQYLYMNAVVAGDVSALQMMTPIRTFGGIVLAVLTISLGGIALGLRGRAKVLAAIALGAGVFALVSMVSTTAISFGYTAF